MTHKLIGADDGTIDANGTNDYFLLQKFTAVFNGTLSEFRVKVSANVNVKAAVYADSAGEPGARLAKKDAGTACTAGWNTITLEGTCSIVSGTVYWLAVNFDAPQVGADSATGVYRYKVATYATWTFPDPAGTGFSSGTSYVHFFAGWGLKIYTVSSDNAIGLETTVTRIANYPRIAAASLGIVSLVSRGIAVTRTSASALGLSAGASRAISILRSASHTLGLSAAVSRIANFPRTASTSMGLSTSVSKVANFIRTTSNTLGLYTLSSLYEKIKRKIATTGTNRTISTTGTNRDISTTGTNRDIEDF